MAPCKIAGNLQLPHIVQLLYAFIQCGVTCRSFLGATRKKADEQLWAVFS
jgi:hypothetical protein